MSKPIIGISGRIRADETTKIIIDQYDLSYVGQDYIDVVSNSGGVPIILPVLSDENLIRALVETMDGIIISGGVDVNSLIYGEEPIKEQGMIIDEIDKFDLALIKIASELKKPILGICRGIQIINVAFGGTLYQDMSQVKDSIKHSQSARRDLATHSVTTAGGTWLNSILGERILTNSYHHQAVKEAAPGFTVSAKAADGVIEAIEKIDTNFVVGVQWHPEMMAKTHSNMLGLVGEFIKISEKTSIK